MRDVGTSSFFVVETFIKMNHKFKQHDGLLFCCLFVCLFFVCRVYNKVKRVTSPVSILVGFTFTMFIFPKGMGTRSNEKKIEGKPKMIIRMLNGTSKKERYFGL